MKPEKVKTLQASVDASAGSPGHTKTAFIERKEREGPPTRQKAGAHSLLCAPYFLAHLAARSEHTEFAWLRKTRDSQPMLNVT